MTALKRPLDVVAAAAAVLPRDPRLLFLMVGDGSLRRAAEEACAEAGIAARFRFVGWVDYERVPAYLSLADIVVLPSAGEAQALVYLEAQAAGRALIATDIPAAREVIAHGETGLLVETGDTEGLAENILVAARDPQLRAELARRGHERVQAHALPRVVARYERLFTGVAR
jgi:glycosyltransferase involved in cell wall biosynthesis